MAISIEAFGDVRTVLDKALESERGIRLRFGSSAARTKFRQRCYQLRMAERRASERQNDPDDPSYGTSDYDVLHFEIELDGSDFCLLIQLSENRDPPGLLKMEVL